jgi:hypothetical protein
MTRSLSLGPRGVARVGPLGLILCADKGEERVELLPLDRSGIRVASSLTELPPRPLPPKKLHDAILLARARLEPPDARAGSLPGPAPE